MYTRRVVSVGYENLLAHTHIHMRRPLAVPLAHSKEIKSFPSASFRFPFARRYKDTDTAPRWLAKELAAPL